MALKTIVLAAMLLPFAGNAFAQKYTIGAEAGGQCSQYNGKLTDGSVHHSAIGTGYYAGLIGDLALTGHVYVQAGLAWSSRQLRDQSNPYFGDIKYRYNLGYAMVPVGVLYKFGREQDNRLYAGLGGYAAYGIAGKLKTLATGSQEMMPPGSGEYIHWGNRNTDDAGTLDAGVSGQAGYELSIGLFFRAQYSFGLINITPEERRSSGSFPHHSNLLITVGYKFCRHNIARF